MRAVDVVGNESYDISANTLNIDITDPIVTETTPVPTPDNDTTPDYSFTTDEAGTIGYGGDCSSADTSASSGLNTVTFNALSEATHSNCTITVTDSV